MYECMYVYIYMYICILYLDVFHIIYICAMSLENHLRAVADAFRPLRNHRLY